MNRCSLALVTALVVLFRPGLGGAQIVTSPAPTASGTLPRLPIDAALLANLPRRAVTVVEEKGESAIYSGVDLGALLAKHGAPNGTALRGRAAADYVLVRAADGYRAVFALTELDAAVTEKIVILADQRNGGAIGADLGPFRMIVPNEKHHLRWVRNVIEVDVLAAP